MNDRAVSVTVNYTISIAVTTLLVSGLLIAAGGILETRHEVATRGELDVVGQRLAAGIMTADRLVQAGGDEVSVQVSMPDQVAGSGYLVEINATDSGSTLALETRDPLVEVTVSFANETTVAGGSVSGGDARIVLGDGGSLEVESA